MWNEYSTTTFTDRVDKSEETRDYIRARRVDPRKVDRDHYEIERDFDHLPPPPISVLNGEQGRIERKRGEEEEEGGARDIYESGREYPRVRRKSFAVTPLIISMTIAAIASSPARREPRSPKRGELPRPR